MKAEDILDSISWKVTTELWRGNTPTAVEVGTLEFNALKNLNVNLDPLRVPAAAGEGPRMHAVGTPNPVSYAVMVDLRVELVDDQSVLRVVCE